MEACLERGHTFLFLASAEYSDETAIVFLKLKNVFDPVFEWFIESDAWYIMEKMKFWMVILNDKVYIFLKIYFGAYFRMSHPLLLF